MNDQNITFIKSIKYDSNIIDVDKSHIYIKTGDSYLDVFALLIFSISIVMIIREIRKWKTQW